MIEQLLINTNVKEEDKLLEKINGIESNQDVQALWGVNNFIAKVEANSMDLLKDIIKTDLKLAMEVSNLLTIIMADSPRKQ